MTSHFQQAHSSRQMMAVKAKAMFVCSRWSAGVSGVLNPVMFTMCVIISFMMCYDFKGLQRLHCSLLTGQCKFHAAKYGTRYV